MKKGEPLVKGGCGHSDEEVTTSAMIFGSCATIALIIAVVAII